MPLQTSVRTDRRQYPVSRAVEILVRMTYTGNAPLAYRVANRFEYEIRVRDSRSRQVVWTWSRGKTPPAGYTVQLQPGQWRQHRELWDGCDDSGRPVPAGVYEIEASHWPDTQTDSTQIYIGGQGKDRPGTGPGESMTEGLQSVLRVDRQAVKSGESLRLSYIVTNRGKEPLLVPFSSGKQFEIEASVPGGGVVWRHTQDQSYIQMLTRLTLAPGEAKTFTRVWTIAPGTEGVVTLTAFLTSNQGALARATTSITIRK